MFLLKMGSGKTIDWVDTLSFIMSKNQKNYDFSIVIETLVRNLSHFFCHNKNPKIIYRVNKLSYQTLSLDFLKKLWPLNRV